MFSFCWNFHLVPLHPSKKISSCLKTTRKYSGWLVLPIYSILNPSLSSFSFECLSFYSSAFVWYVYFISLFEIQLTLSKWDSSPHYCEGTCNSALLLLFFISKGSICKRKFHQTIWNLNVPIYRVKFELQEIILIIQKMMFWVVY